MVMIMMRRGVGGLVVHYCSCLSVGMMLRLMINTKSQCIETPFNLFESFSKILTNFAVEIMFDVFSVQNLGPACAKCAKKIVVGGK